MLGNNSLCTCAVHTATNAVFIVTDAVFIATKAYGTT